MKLASLSLYRKEGSSAKFALLASEHQVSPMLLLWKSSITSLYEAIALKLAETSCELNQLETFNDDEQPDYRGHVMSNHLGFYVVALTDHDYPSNAVAALLIRILQRVATAPSNTPYGPLLQYFLKLFTNPPADASVKVTAADVSKDIQEVIEIMQGNIEKAIDRNVRLETLMKDTEALSKEAELFKKQATKARKHFQCCHYM